eukprot:2480433-Pyramimonas_sp.AAC.2
MHTTKRREMSASRKVARRCAIRTASWRPLAARGPPPPRHAGSRRSPLACARLLECQRGLIDWSRRNLGPLKSSKRGPYPSTWRAEERNAREGRGHNK